MKKICVIIYIFVFCLFKVTAQSDYKTIINFNLGEIKIKKSKIFIEIFQADSLVKYKNFEIVIPKTNKFSYTLQTKQPFLGLIRLQKSDSNSIVSGGCVFANEKMDVNLIKDFLEVESTQTNFLQNNANLYLGIPYILRNNSNFTLENIKRSYQINIGKDLTLYNQHLEYERNIIKQVSVNKNYFHTLYQFYNTRYYLSLATLEKCYSILEKVYMGNEYLIKLDNYIKQSKNIFIGKKVPFFYADDLKGNKTSFENFYNTSELTLIDFWASWCVPCRLQMKELVPLYQKTDSIKLKVISVSLDKSIDDWKRASTNDKILWSNYVDSLGFNGNVAKSFNIISIPFNFLINSKGEIIKINVTVDQLKVLMKITD